MSVIVLNADYTYLHNISWQRAINLIMKGKVEVLKNTSKVIYGINRAINIPLIVRLIKFVRRFYKKKIPLHKNNIFIRDEFLCQYCGSACNKNPTIDHIVPKSRGGDHSWVNIVTACNKCNQKKGNKTPNEAKMHLIKPPVRPTINEFAQKKIKCLGIKKFIDELFEIGNHTS
ncbi:MAG TPA: HNH endonuclease [Desulfohalobiaceae bacterium]|nr:HNH endonuclease [Desulfohalobiaceae bacterium]